MAIAVATFLIALAIIASEKLHRTNVALLGAAIVVLFVGDFSQEQAIESVDFNTIGLLVGMMILVYLTQQTGVYDYVAIRAGQISGGRSFAVTMSLAGITAILSAFLDNLTTILLIAPITFLLADALDIDAVPLLIIEVMASNIGGTATLIGDPPNIIIAGATGLSFNAFIINLAPIVIVTFAVRYSENQSFDRRSSVGCIPCWIRQGRESAELPQRAQRFCIHPQWAPRQLASNACL